MQSDGGSGERPALLAGFASGPRAWPYRSAVHRLLGRQPPDDLSFGSTPLLPPGAFAYLGRQSTEDSWSRPAAGDVSRPTVRDRVHPDPTGAPLAPAVTPGPAISEPVRPSRQARELRLDPDTRATEVIAPRHLDRAREAATELAVRGGYSEVTVAPSTTPPFPGSTSPAGGPAAIPARAVNAPGPAPRPADADGVHVHRSVVAVPSPDRRERPRPVTYPAPAADLPDLEIGPHRAPTQARSSVLDRPQEATAGHGHRPVPVGADPVLATMAPHLPGVPEPRDRPVRSTPHALVPALPGRPADRSGPRPEPAEQAFRPGTSEGVERLPARLPQPRAAATPAPGSLEPRPSAPFRPSRVALSRAAGVVVAPVRPRQMIPRSFWSSSALRATHRGVLR